MPLDSISSLVRMLMHLFAKYTMAPRNNGSGTDAENDASQVHHTASIFTSDSNLPPVPEPSFEHESSLSVDDLNEQLSSFEEVHENQIWGAHHDDYLSHSFS